MCNELRGRRRCSLPAAGWLRSSAWLGPPLAELHPPDHIRVAVVLASLGALLELPELLEGEGAQLAVLGLRGPAVAIVEEAQHVVEVAAVADRVDLVAQRLALVALGVQTRARFFATALRPSTNF